MWTNEAQIQAFCSISIVLHELPVSLMNNRMSSDVQPWHFAKPSLTPTRDCSSCSLKLLGLISIILPYYCGDYRYHYVIMCLPFTSIAIALYSRVPFPILKCLYLMPLNFTVFGIHVRVASPYDIILGIIWVYILLVSQIKNTSIFVN